MREEQAVLLGLSPEDTLDMVGLHMMRFDDLLVGGIDLLLRLCHISCCHCLIGLAALVARLARSDQDGHGILGSLVGFFFHH